MKTPDPVRIDRRVAIKWMLTASAGAMLVNVPLFGAPETAAPGTPGGARGYGTDPDLMKVYKPGDVWPLTLSDARRREVAALCDIIVPADDHSPSASSVGVTDFIDEWVSAPYPSNVADAKVIGDGLDWVDAESKKRFGAPFSDATDAQRLSLCEEISHDAPAGSDLESASKFFKRFRNLTTGGFYTTPAGMKDLGYVGNVPLARFDGPPADIIEKLGLTDEVKW
jgi:Gluconate 2-dehydrogenase subunit 3